MLSSFNELLASLRVEVTEAEAEAQAKADAAAVDGADAAAAAFAASAAAVANATWQPISEAEIRSLQVEHARGLVLASSQRRAASLLSAFVTPLDAPSLAELARLTLEDLELEQSYFGRAFDKLDDGAYVAALTSRVRLLMAAAAPCLTALRTGGNDAVIGSADDTLGAFEDWSAVWPLLGALDRRLKKAKLPPLDLGGGVTDVSELMGPLVSGWITHLTTRFDEELELAWRRETWEPLGDAMAPTSGLGGEGGATGGVTGYAAIVWDLLKLFMSTVEVFFGEFERAALAGGRSTPIRAEWVSELAFKIFLSLNRFLNRMRQDLGSWHALLPKPMPPLQLESNEVKFAIEASRFVKKASTMVQGSQSEEGLDVTAAARAELRAMCVKVNSLLFCRQQVKALAEYIDSRWVRLIAAAAADATAEGRMAAAVAGFTISPNKKRESAASPQPLVPPPETVLHEEAEQAVGATLDEVLTYIGAHLVFRSLREPLLQRLYSRASETAELSPMLHARAAPKAKRPSIGGQGSRRTFYLGEVMDSLLILIGRMIYDDATHDALILSVLTALATALETVLLQGEPRRTFTADDSPRLLADVHMVREYFIARDEHGEPAALPEDIVHAETSRLEALIQLMGRSSEELLGEVFSSHRYGADGQQVKPHPEWDENDPLNQITLVRVLMARAKLDPIAQRFVEQHKDALRELLQRGVAVIKFGTRHGKGVSELRAKLEAEAAAEAASAAAEAEAEEAEAERRSAAEAQPKSSAAPSTAPPAAVSVWSAAEGPPGDAAERRSRKNFFAKGRNAKRQSDVKL